MTMCCNVLCDGLIPFSPDISFRRSPWIWALCMQQVHVYGTRRITLCCCHGAPVHSIAPPSDFNIFPEYEVPQNGSLRNPGTGALELRSAACDLFNSSSALEVLLFGN